jgi:hypothetical protein
MRLTVLLAALVAALAVASPASAATAPNRCRPHHGEHVVARSAQAVVLSVQYAYPDRITGCSRATGRRRRIAGVTEMTAFRVVLTGTRVALVEYGGDRSGESSAVIIADDALHTGRRALVGRRDEVAPPSVEFPTVVLADDGRIAWLEPRFTTTTLRVWRPGDTVRTLDEAIAIDHVQLAFDGSPTVTWAHDGSGRSSMPWAVPDRCPRAGLVRGTAELDLLPAPGGTTVCARATGATATLPGVEPRSVATDHGWAAAWVESSILVASPVTGASRTVPAGSRGYGVVVDAAGSAAWPVVTQPNGPPATSTTVEVDDATGTHAAWSGDDSIDLRHDDSLVLWRTTAYGTIGRALMAPRP